MIFKKPFHRIFSLCLVLALGLVKVTVALAEVEDISDQSGKNISKLLKERQSFHIQLDSSRNATTTVSNGHTAKEANIRKDECDKGGFVPPAILHLMSLPPNESIFSSPPELTLDESGEGLKIQIGPFIDVCAGWLDFSMEPKVVKGKKYNVIRAKLNESLVEQNRNKAVNKGKSPMEIFKETCLQSKSYGPMYSDEKMSNSEQLKNLYGGKSKVFEFSLKNDKKNKDFFTDAEVVIPTTSIDMDAFGRDNGGYEVTAQDSCFQYDRATPPNTKFVNFEETSFNGFNVPSELGSDLVNLKQACSGDNIKNIVKLAKGFGSDAGVMRPVIAEILKSYLDKKLKELGNKSIDISHREKLDRDLYELLDLYRRYAINPILSDIRSLEKRQKSIYSVDKNLEIELERKISQLEEYTSGINLDFKLLMNFEENGILKSAKLVNYFAALQSFQCLKSTNDDSEPFQVACPPYQKSYEGIARIVDKATRSYEGTLKVKNEIYLIRSFDPSDPRQTRMAEGILRARTQEVAKLYEREKAIARDLSNLPGLVERQYQNCVMQASQYAMNPQYIMQTLGQCESQKNAGERRQSEYARRLSLEQSKIKSIRAESVNRLYLLKSVALEKGIGQNSDSPTNAQRGINPDSDEALAMLELVLGSNGSSSSQPGASQLNPGFNPVGPLVLPVPAH